VSPDTSASVQNVPIDTAKENAYDSVAARSCFSTAGGLDTPVASAGASSQMCVPVASAKTGPSTRTTQGGRDQPRPSATPMTSPIADRRRKRVAVPANLNSARCGPHRRPVALATKPASPKATPATIAMRNPPASAPVTAYMIAGGSVNMSPRVTGGMPSASCHHSRSRVRALPSCRARKASHCLACSGS
jgi:hypothetical protein